MIRRLLIANRGEIALRIVRACRELGIECAAVYSDADVAAPHVVAADLAVRIGPPPAAESYLSIPAILAAARTTSSDAIHPGYGFLAENAALAQACEEAAVTFVGPPADVIASMGSKVSARQIMQAAGVPVVPGAVPEDQSDAGIRDAVGRMGLPALIKASAGGGGRGMRRVRREEEVVEAIQSARREALAAFGDGTLYVERLLEHARHIEVQLLADLFGNVVHLFERECSTQRRHQKLIEESPSPAVTADLRRRITAAAVSAARAAKYRNAGTIEFLLDNGTFYFLEMNTRLQVEHPVTEEVVGVDLVRAQLTIASSEPLAWGQASLAQRGHAIEARVYAEAPEHGFLPQSGRLLLYREPHRPGVRIDSGVAEGGEVPIHYDSLLAKVIARGEDRGQALARLIQALRDFPILGVRTNVDFLLRILGDPRFRSGRVDTEFVDENLPALTHREQADVPRHVMAAVAAHRAVGAAPTPAAGDGSRSTGGINPWDTMQNWRSQ